MLSTNFCRVSDCGSTATEREYFMFNETSNEVMDEIRNAFLMLESMEHDEIMTEAFRPNPQQKPSNTASSKQKRNILEIIGGGVKKLFEAIIAIISKAKTFIDKLSFEHKSEAKKIEQYCKAYPQQAETMNTMWKEGKINVEAAKTFKELDKAFTDAIHHPDPDDMLKTWNLSKKKFDELNKKFEEGPEKKVDAIYVIRALDGKIVEAKEVNANCEKWITEAKREMESIVNTLDPDNEADMARARAIFSVYDELLKSGNDALQINQKEYDRVADIISSFRKRALDYEEAQKKNKK